MRQQIVVLSDEFETSQAKFDIPGFFKTQKVQKSWIFNIIVVESEANWERLTNIGSYDPKFNHVV